MLNNFSQFVVIHTVKGFIIVNEAEKKKISGISLFLHDLMNVDNLIWLISLF